MAFEIKRKQKNRHGVFYRGCGNFIFVYKPDSGDYLCCLRWIDVDSITAEIVMEDFRPFKQGRFFWSRVNKHGVEFLFEGARFFFEGSEYEIGLPYSMDFSHMYTPEMLMEIMRRYGSYSNKSQMWRKLESVEPCDPYVRDVLEGLEPNCGAEEKPSRIDPQAKPLCYPCNVNGSDDMRLLLTVGVRFGGRRKRKKRS